MISSYLKIKLHKKKNDQFLFKDKLHNQFLFKDKLHKKKNYDHSYLKIKIT